MVYAKFNGVHKTKLLYGTKKEKSLCSSLFYEPVELSLSTPKKGIENPSAGTPGVFCFEVELHGLLISLCLLALKKERLPTRCGLAP